VALGEADADFAPIVNDPLRRVTPPVDDVEARRARAAVESRLFGAPREPVAVGRYRISGRIGKGGMGVVYRAHDPELARDVAVKVLNAEAVHGSDAEAASARLVREARAMARLAHPHVIHVYDVGTVDDDVFVAMELVEGRDLASWLEASPRPWRDILRRCVDAGAGLAAAHAAGVIHRDFKPENVLVGDDGRVRVVDFGLAGGASIAVEDNGEETTEGEDEDETGSDTEREPLRGSLTKTGALLGTPKYMAPEQYTGATSNARSDQFSFCVTLFESLYGVAPFVGDTVRAYRRSVQTGEIEQPPADTTVPAWVYDEIVRGLAVDPAARHPGMDGLLDRLREALIVPTKRGPRPLRLLVVGAVAVAATAVLAWWVGGTPEELESVASRSAPPVPAAVVDPKEGEQPPTPAPVEAPPAAPEPAEKEKPKPARAKRPQPQYTEYCYYSEDRLKPIMRKKRKRKNIRGGYGKCYECWNANRSQRAGIADKDCLGWRVCKEVADDSCPG
jgi:serine/threonine protein kinase